MFRIHWSANQPWMEHKKGAFVVKDIRSGRAGAEQPAPPLHQPGDETNKANLKKKGFFLRPCRGFTLRTLDQPLRLQSASISAGGCVSAQTARPETAAASK